MRRLLVVDHIVNAGGVERCLEESVRALLEEVRHRDWHLTLLINPINTAGKQVQWAEAFGGPRCDVRYLFASRAHRWLDWVRRPRRILGVPGTTRALDSIRRALCASSSRRLRSLGGDSRAFVEETAASGDFDLGFFSFPFNMDCPELPFPMVILPHDFVHKHPAYAPDTAPQTERQLSGWLEAASGIVVNSHFVHDEIRRFYPAHAAKARVVRLGIPASQATVSEAFVKETRARFPRHFVLSCGWLTPHKDQLALVEAVGKLKREGISVGIVFTGPNTLDFGRGSAPGGYRGRMERRARELDLQAGRELFGLGYVDAATLVALYRSATALVLTSHYEAGSFPVREALLQECPVVCSSIAPMREEMAAVGDPARFFEPGDIEGLAREIRSVVSDEAAARRRVALSRPLLDSVFSWRKLAVDYLSIFEEILGDSAQATQRAGNG